MTSLLRPKAEVDMATEEENECFDFEGAEQSLGMERSVVVRTLSNFRYSVECRGSNVTSLFDYYNAPAATHVPLLTNNAFISKNGEINLPIQLELNSLYTRQ